MKLISPIDSDHDFELVDDEVSLNSSELQKSIDHYPILVSVTACLRLAFCGPVSGPTPGTNV